MLPVTFLPPAKKFFKKLRDNQLKKEYEQAIMRVRHDPEVGTLKTGDLAGVYGYDIHYKGVNYELAYYLAENDQGEVVVIIMAGTRENFWDTIKRYIK